MMPTAVLLEALEFTLELHIFGLNVTFYRLHKEEHDLILKKAFAKSMQTPHDSDRDMDYYDIRNVTVQESTRNSPSPFSLLSDGGVLEDDGNISIVAANSMNVNDEMSGSMDISDFKDIDMYRKRQRNRGESKKSLKFFVILGDRWKLEAASAGIEVEAHLIVDPNRYGYENQNVDTEEERLAARSQARDQLYVNLTTAFSNSLVGGNTSTFYTALTELSSSSNTTSKFHLIESFDPNAVIGEQGYIVLHSAYPTSAPTATPTCGTGKFSDLNAGPVRCGQCGPGTGVQFA